jgi:hypothetical protein
MIITLFTYCLRNYQNCIVFIITIPHVFVEHLALYNLHKVVMDPFTSLQAIGSE